MSRKPKAATWSVIYRTGGRWFRAPDPFDDYATARERANALAGLGLEAYVHPTRALNIICPADGWG